MKGARGPGARARDDLARRLSTAVGALPERPPGPAYVVDLDAFDANAADLARRAGGTPVRIASKSVRVPALLARALALPPFHGVLAYSLAEALFLHRSGVSDDLVLGYPVVDRTALAALLADEAAASAITLMTDDPAQLDVVDEVRASLPGQPDTPVRVAIDVDAGLRRLGQHLGPKRSPLHDISDVVRYAEHVLARPGFRLVGVMTYEGQVAGVPDAVPGQRAKSAVVRKMKAASVRQLDERRHAVAAALAPLVDLELWNSGGTGSLETSAVPPVTELAAGSGLLVPHLFDHYRSFTAEPAAFLGVPVVRRPSASTVTVAGGGLIASGPVAADRAPVPWAPAGLSLTGMEGAGEVQTPLTGPGTNGLRIGDLVWFRHAKAGEPAEHVRQVHLVQGDAVVDTVPTYRGLDQAW
ncbi:alanine racemase [Nocardioides sp.]|uniref:alanine racemase n=1 Tax=Nocardioides sp. TaxID=35761 RepID=UPI00273433A9|nr:alanine racemase [Nocardioides sp.]MDP3892754.1 alanine racemase [Nocardioides sp.]